MAKYDIKYACGCERTVNLFGKNADRERKIAWLETQICPQCAAKAAAEAAKAEADANGLPELEGTPKQVAWALDIRAEWSAKVLKMLAMEPKTNEERLLQQAAAEVLNNTSAKFWIENRERNNLDKAVKAVLDRLISEDSSKTGGDDDDGAGDDSPAANAETATLAPEGRDATLTVEITEGENEIAVATPERNDEMSGMIRNRMRGKWDSSRRAWIVPPEGTHRADRITEIASVSLAEGYRVKIPAKYAERVKAGDYRPATSRRITVALKDGCYCVKWDRINDDFYKVAKRLPSAQWDSDIKAVKVNPRYYNEVTSFAERYGFEVSDAAMEAMEKARAEIESEEVIGVTPTVKTPSMPSPSSKPQKMAVPDDIEIDESLRDED